MVRFLDPETAEILQFLDPEIVKMDKKISGSRNRRNGAISGSRNRRKGRQILYVNNNQLKGFITDHIGNKSEDPWQLPLAEVPALQGFPLV